MRTAVQNDTLLRHLVEPNGNPDIFIHTYRTANAPTPNWHGDNVGHDKSAAPDLAWALATYPNVRGVEMDTATGGHEYAPTAACAKACPARWSASRAIDMAWRFHQPYDVVFMARFDLWLGSDLVLPLPEPKTIYGSHFKHDKADGDVFLYGRHHEIASISREPFPDDVVAISDGAGFEGEQTTTAIRKSLGYEYRVHPVRHGLLRSNGVFLVVP